MSPLNAYSSNFSNEEFLSTAFILMRKKVKRIYELKLLEPLCIEDLQEKHEKASQVIQSLVFLESLLDLSNPSYEEAVNAYRDLQLLIFKGNNEDAKYLEIFLNKLP